MKQTSLPTENTSETVSQASVQLDRTKQQEFQLEGVVYGSVEGFAQAIKLIPEDPRRAVVEKMNREDARAFGAVLAQELGGEKPASVYWNGDKIPFGSDHHAAIMSLASRAFESSLGHLPDPRNLIANVVSGSRDYSHVSNFAHTPFEIGGLEFASVEAFIQYIKYPPSDSQREAVRGLHGVDAKRAGGTINREIYAQLAAKEPAYVYWNDEKIPYRSNAHEALIEQALRAKFSASEIATQELLSTVNRYTGEAKTIVHKTRKENPLTSLPSENFAALLMKIRDDLIPGYVVK